MKVDPAELVGINEIAHNLGVQPNVVGNWTKRYASFPKPVRVLSCGSVWRWADINKWHDLRTTMVPTTRDWDVA